MRRLKNYNLEREPFEKPLLTYRDKGGIHAVELMAGRLDEIEVFRESGKVYVLCWNEKHRYAGIEMFRGQERIGDVFLESGDVETALGRKGLELTSISMVKRLAKHLTRSGTLGRRGAVG